MNRGRRKKEVPSKELRQKEKEIIELARIAWNYTIKEFYYPPLNEPIYVFDYTRQEGFYIDPVNRWQITMNLANTPLFTEDEDYIKYYHAISLHEVSHYQIIPYDGITNAKLLRAAMKQVSRVHAPVIVNIFSDLIIDTKLFREHPDLMSWELENTYKHVSSRLKGQFSDFSKFLFRAYEKMWEMDITGDPSLSEMDNLVNKVKNVIMKDFEDETSWEQKVTKVAYHLKTLIKDTFPILGIGQPSDKGKTQRRTDKDIFVEIPEDVLEIMDNPLENKNWDKLKEDNSNELQQKAEEFAKNIPYSEFGAPAGQAGLLIDGNILSTWYRGVAKDLIKIKIFEEKPGGQLPIYPEVWRIGDPMEQLDLPLTLLNSPIIIPNVTTRKWTYKEGPGLVIEKQIPDLLIVLDSSGSMGWNYSARSVSARGPYHTAVVASFAALHHAASKGVKFSVINFSNRADTCKWTTDYRKAEKTILRYQGGGTVLPIKAIASQCEKAERKVLVIIITDFGIYNWAKAKKQMIDLANNGHKIVGFFIGASKIPQDRFKNLLDKVNFYPIRNIKDLIDLVIDNIKRYYF